MSDRIAVHDDGRVEQVGTPERDLLRSRPRRTSPASSARRTCFECEVSDADGDAVRVPAWVRCAIRRSATRRPGTGRVVVRPERIASAPPTSRRRAGHNALPGHGRATCVYLGAVHACQRRRRRRPGAAGRSRRTDGRRPRGTPRRLDRVSCVVHRRDAARVLPAKPRRAAAADTAGSPTCGTADAADATRSAASRADARRSRGAATQLEPELARRVPHRDVVGARPSRRPGPRGRPGSTGRRAAQLNVSANVSTSTVARSRRLAGPRDDPRDQCRATAGRARRGPSPPRGAGTPAPTGRTTVPRRRAPRRRPAGRTSAGPASSSRSRAAVVLAEQLLGRRA